MEIVIKPFYNVKRDLFFVIKDYTHSFIYPRVLRNPDTIKTREAVASSS